MGPEILVFMVSLHCQTDFQADFWNDFDRAMGDEWGVNATTTCYQTDAFPSSLQDYKSLANRMAMRETSASPQPGDFTTYFDNLLQQGANDRQNRQVIFLTKYSEAVFKNRMASGIAYPAENVAFVKNNFEYSTGTLSHELLHLALEEQGYDKSCYVDKVHENQFAYVTKEMGAGKYPVIKRFSC